MNRSSFSLILLSLPILPDLFCYILKLPYASPTEVTFVDTEHCWSKLKDAGVKLVLNIVPSRSQWPRGLKRGSAAARFLGLRVRIQPGTWMFVPCECCVLSGRGLCGELISGPEESYWLWCVWVWWSTMRRSWPEFTKLCFHEVTLSHRMTERHWITKWKDVKESGRGLIAGFKIGVYKFKKKLQSSQNYKRQKE